MGSMNVSTVTARSRSEPREQSTPALRNHTRLGVVLPLCVIVALAIVCIVIAALTSAQRANDVASSTRRTCSRTPSPIAASGRCASSRTVITPDEPRIELRRLRFERLIKPRPGWIQDAVRSRLRPGGRRRRKSGAFDHQQRCHQSGIAADDLCRACADAGVSAWRAMAPRLSNVVWLTEPKRVRAMAHPSARRRSCRRSTSGMSIIVSIAIDSVDGAEVKRRKFAGRARSCSLSTARCWPKSAIGCSLRTCASSAMSRVPAGDYVFELSRRARHRPSRASPGRRNGRRRRFSTASSRSSRSRSSVSRCSRPISLRYMRRTAAEIADAEEPPALSRAARSAQRFAEPRLFQRSA